MKITFVIPGVTGGGVRVIAEYAKGLARYGHDVRLLYPRASIELRRALRDIYLRSRYGSRDKWLRTFRGETKAYARLTPELAGRNDVLIGVGADCALAIANLPDSCGAKVHNCHGRELNNMQRMLEAWRLPMPRIVVASYLEREMRQHGSTDEIHLVHNGVDRTEYFPSMPDEERGGVGTVFHGAYTKGPELILAVLQRIHRSRPNTPLMMFGSYPRPAGLPEVTRYVRLPSIAAAKDMYSQAAVWFCASRSEGFPGPVLEAMACGCALVSTDCGGTADQIEDGVSGFIVPVDDVEQMTERILRLLDDPQLRQRIVSASRARLAQFTWPNTIRSLEAALTAIVTKAAPKAVKSGSE